MQADTTALPSSAHDSTGGESDARAATASPLQARFGALRDALQAEVIGQPALVERLLIALLADGHLLVGSSPNRKRGCRQDAQGE